MSWPLGIPLLKAVVIGEWRAVEGVLEVRLRVRAAQEVLAGSDLADGIHRLAVLDQVDAGEQRMHHAGLIGIDDEFLIAHRQAAFEPAGGVQHEVDAGEAGRQQRLGRLEGRLRIGDFRCAQRAAGAERYAEPAREGGHHVQHQGGLGRAELGAPDCIEIDEAKLPSTRRAGVHQLRERHAGERSASVCAAVPATVTGDIAPARIKGVMMQA